MRGLTLRFLAWAVLVAAPALLSDQAAVEDPAVRAAVERFFAAQEAEDVAGYLALWSSTAQKPRPDQLKFIFDAGDDRFHDLEIARVSPVGDLVRVLVIVQRERTDATAKRADGMPRVSNMRRQWSLTFAREAGGLKLISEGVPADDLAAALVAASSDADRERLLAAEPDLVNNRLVGSLSQRASSLAQQSRFAEAEKVYGIVLDVSRRAGDRKAEGEALQNLGNTRYYQRDMTGALAAYQERVTLERGIANDEGLAGALLGMATIRYARFEYGVALGHYSEALALFEKLEDDIGVATTLISTGNVAYLQGDYDSAIRDYRRSRDLNRKVSHTAGEARALEGLGRTMTAQGDHAGALEAFAGVADEGRARGDLPMRGNASQSIGEVHFRLGNLDAARAAFDESRTHFESTKDLRATGRVWQAIGLTELVANRFAAAEQAYDKSIIACAASQDSPCVAGAIVGLAFAHHSQEEYNDAIASYRKAIAAFLALNAGTEAARAEVGLSQSLYGKKEFAAAVTAAAHAREQSTVPDVLWRSHLSEARAHRQLKDRAKAMTAARASVSVVQSMAEHERRLPSQRVPVDSADAYAFLAVLHADAADAVAAFAAMEQRRAHALRAALVNNERDIARGMTPEDREAERLMTAAVVSIQVQIDRERELPVPDMARVEELSGRLADAIGARALLQQRLFERLPELVIWRGLAPPVTVDDLPALLLSDDITMAAFVIDNDDLLAVVASRQDGRVEVGAHTVPIRRRELAELIAASVTPAMLRAVEAWRAASGDLVKVLPLKAVEALAASRRAIIIPDDVLWRVPFEALPLQEGYLSDRTAVTYASSVTALMRPPAMRESAAEAVSPPLLAVGAPVLPLSMLARMKATAPGWTLRAGDASEREVREAAAVYTVTEVAMLVGPEATEAALRAAAPRAAVLHLALPFRLNSASPMFSPLLSSVVPQPAEPGQPVLAPIDDGVLEAREVMNLKLSAQVAVLSDGAALSMRDAAAATGTLQWAWRAAGVPSLVVARWSTEEPAGQPLLVGFHTRIEAGDPPDEAMHAARTAVRARAATRAPWFWAQYMIVGRDVHTGR